SEQREPRRAQHLRGEGGQVLRTRAESEADPQHAALVARALVLGLLADPVQGVADGTRERHLPEDVAEDLEGPWDQEVAPPAVRRGLRDPLPAPQPLLQQ